MRKKSFNDACFNARLSLFALRRRPASLRLARRLRRRGHISAAKTDSGQGWLVESATTADRCSRDSSAMY